TLHGLVAELASYVDALPAFTATIEEYETDFKENFYHALVAEVDGRVVGMALYVFKYSTWKGRMIYLEDFVLEPEFRRRGIGQQLWDALLEVGRNRGCKLLKWQIVDTNTEAMKFYAAQDAIIENNWLDGKLWLS
ncbi:MAG: GNAT family N-acetyltransferase, partial [Bacteroidota bacterium]